MNTDKKKDVVYRLQCAYHAYHEGYCTEHFLLWKAANQKTFSISGLPLHSLSRDASVHRAAAHNFNMIQHFLLLSIQTTQSIKKFCYAGEWDSFGGKIKYKPFHS